MSVGVIDGLLFGLTSVLVPWFFFFLCLGKGVMARPSPDPLTVCALSLMMHSLFGASICLGFRFFRI